ncbi:hypothetical protein, partial [Lactobacillus delbrueckii]|uniref:hypothetical protein n=1 Tax=Lactobacillus delbrueckii TaxID=1584 RepID=UPI00405859CC
PNLTAFTGVDSQNLPDVMVSVQFILAIGEIKLRQIKKETLRPPRKLSIIIVIIVVEVSSFLFSCFSAFKASLRFVIETFFLVEFLFTLSEYKFLVAIFTYYSFILHLNISSSLWIKLIKVHIISPKMKSEMHKNWLSH